MIILLNENQRHREVKTEATANQRGCWYSREPCVSGCLLEYTARLHFLQQTQEVEIQSMCSEKEGAKQVPTWHPKEIYFLGVGGVGLVFIKGSDGDTHLLLNLRSDLT